MIDVRTKFFAIAGGLAFLLILVAPEDLKYVPFWLGIVYMILTLLCFADSFSRYVNRKK